MIKVIRSLNRLPKGSSRPESWDESGESESTGRPSPCTCILQPTANAGEHMCHQTAEALLRILQDHIFSQIMPNEYGEVQIVSAPPPLPPNQRLPHTISCIAIDRSCIWHIQHSFPTPPVALQLSPRGMQKWIPCEDRI